MIEPYDTTMRLKVGNDGSKPTDSTSSWEEACLAYAAQLMQSMLQEPRRDPPTTLSAMLFYLSKLSAVCCRSVVDSFDSLQVPPSEIKVCLQPLSCDPEIIEKQEELVQKLLDEQDLLYGQISHLTSSITQKDSEFGHQQNLFAEQNRGVSEAQRAREARVEEEVAKLRLALDKENERSDSLLFLQKKLHGEKKELQKELDSAKREVSSAQEYVNGPSDTGDIL